MKKILQKEEPVLRKIAKEIPLPKIQTLKIKKVIKEMFLSLASQDDGVAIAAPQIGYSYRIFIVSGKIFNKNFVLNRENKNSPHLFKSEDFSESERPDPLLKKEREKKYKDLVFINPQIIKLSKEKEWMPEGCLSVRPLYGKTYRSKKATISAYNEEGVKFTRGSSGLLAQIFQHETDHLNGILFIDHAEDIREETLPNDTPDNT